MVFTEIIQLQDDLSKQIKSYWLAKINNLQQTIGSVGGGGDKTSQTDQGLYM